MEKRVESKVVNLSEAREHREESRVYDRWVIFYRDQSHEDILQSLVYEHENNFPLRNSPHKIDQLRHKALVNVLDERAQTEFLKSLLREIN